MKRGGEKIAELIVTNLEKNRSVCDIVPGSMQPGQMLRPGDRVTVSPESMPKPKSQTPETPATGGGAALPDAAPGEAGAPVDDGMDAFDPAPAPDTGDPFGDLGAPAEDPAPAEAEAPAADDPFSDL